jgi:hypothetical protein
LRQCETRCGQSEVHPTRLLNAIRILTKWDPIQVELQELIFAVLVFEFTTKDEFLEFATDDILTLQVKGIAGELAREC